MSSITNNSTIENTNKYIALYCVNQLHPLIVNIDDCTQIQNIRNSASQLLMTDVQGILLYQVVDGMICKIDTVFDNCMAVQVFTCNTTIYCTQVEDRAQQLRYERQWSERMTKVPFNVRLHNLTSGEEAAYHPTVTDRVRDLRSFIVVRFSLAANTAELIQLQTNLSESPIITEDQSLVRDVIPDGEVVYFLLHERNRHGLSYGNLQQNINVSFVQENQQMQPLTSLRNLREEPTDYSDERNPMRESDCSVQLERACDTLQSNSSKNDVRHTADSSLSELSTTDNIPRDPTTEPSLSGAHLMSKGPLKKRNSNNTCLGLSDSEDTSSFSDSKDQTSSVESPRNGNPGHKKQNDPQLSNIEVETVNSSSFDNSTSSTATESSDSVSVYGRDPVVGPVHDGNNTDDKLKNVSENKSKNGYSNNRSLRRSKRLYTAQKQQEKVAKKRASYRAAMGPPHRRKQTFDDKRQKATDESSHSFTAAIEDDDLWLQCCCNCYRAPSPPLETFDSRLLSYEPKLIEVALHDLRLSSGRRRLFVNIDRTRYIQDVNGRQYVKICNVCYGFLISSPASAKDAALVWPSFVCKALRDEDIYGATWRLLPAPWRQWWVRAVSFLHQVTQESLMEQRTIFNEVTYDLEQDIAALQSLRWSTDVLPREESLVIAEVKCPAGCAEFKHKAKHLPLDIVWKYLLNAEINLYSNPSKFKCTNWFRSDYDIPDVILWNPDWLCRPSIAYCRETLAPVVLTCRYHDDNNNRFMIHPCRHPTGTVATEKSSQFTPVTPVPRTLRKAKYSAFSGSFHIAKMQGSYHGLDTMFLASDGGYHFYQSKLAWMQERYAALGRKDLRAYIARLSSMNKIAPGLAKSLLKKDTILSQHMQNCVSGSTYISVDDSVRLQKNLFYEKLETTRAHPTLNGTREQVVYRGAWPKHCFFVHPGNSRHGAKPFMPPTFTIGMKKQDARAAWILSSLLLCVPEIWEQCTSSYKMITSWEGWLLTFLTSKTLTHLSEHGAKSPFSVLTQWDLFSKYIQPEYNRGYQPSLLFEKFNPLASQIPKYTNIQLQSNRFTPPKDITKTIVIVVKDLKRATRQPITCPRFLEQEHRHWELRYIALSEPAAAAHSNKSKWYGSVYMRHGKDEHPYWWKLGQKQTIPQSLPPEWKPACLGQHIDKWNVCVFVRKVPFIGETLQRSVLGACGGQNQVVCGMHKYPLILSSPNDTNIVCTYLQTFDSSIETVTSHCVSHCKYRCPHDECFIGLCNRHFETGTAAHDSFSISQISASDRSVVMNLRLRQKSEKVNTTPKKTINRPFFVNHTSPVLDKLRNDASDESNPASHIAQLRIHELQQDTFAIGAEYGFEDADQIDSESDMDSLDPNNDLFSPDIPTTDAGVEPTFVNIQTPGLLNTRMTNHALLNCYGSCLVRRNKKLVGTVAQRSFLQKLVATNDGECIPLIYPEGMLFSDIFYKDTNDGSVIGAIPAALLHGDRVLRRCGMSTLQETYRTRLISPGLLSSSNPKYHFWAFDALANFSLRGCDSRVILRRGFAELQDNGGVRIRGIKEPVFDSDHVECRTIVNKLCATSGERLPTYFYTHTLSMKTHFGFRILWEWLTGPSIVKLLCPEETEREINDWRRSLLDSAGVYLLRAWMELIEIWLLYITKSPDKPMGNVDMYLARMELQNALSDVSSTEISKGNLPHMHGLFWTSDNLYSRDGLHAACDRIRGSIIDIVRPQEQDKYISDGVFKTAEEADCFRATMQRFLHHEHHRRCFVMRRDKISGEFQLDKVCKVADNWRLTEASGDHIFRDMQVNHTNEAIKVMMDIGVAERTPLTEGQYYEFIPKYDFLTGIKHIPPCMGNDGIMSPVIGALVAINPNSDNCQLASGYFIARYLAKYIIKIDEYCVINIAPPKTTDDSKLFNVQAEELLNTKITSNRIAQQTKLDRGYNRHHRNALGINVTDVYMKILNYPTIYTNLKHVKYTTSPYENRSARKRLKPIERLVRSTPSLQQNALTPINTIPAHHVRTTNPATPSWRNFTAGQIKKSFDDLHSPLSTDQVTIFSSRPPELHFVMHQRVFFRWFSLERISNTTHTPTGNTRQVYITSLPELIQYCHAHYDPTGPLEETQWISSLSCIVKLRCKAISEILSYIQEAPSYAFSSHTQGQAQTIRGQILGLFRSLKDAIEYHVHGTYPPDTNITPAATERLERLIRTFVAETNETTLPTPWTTPVRPTQSILFLIHLLLSFGAFIDEYDLFCSGNLRQAFIKARLLEPTSPMQSTIKLMKKYFMVDLKTLPAGTPTFDRYCSLAYNVIYEFFTNNVFYTDEIPSVLYCRLKQETEKSVASFALHRKTQLVTTLLKRLYDSDIAPLPSASALLHASLDEPLDWDIASLKRPAGQPYHSYIEQSTMLQKGKHSIDAYIAARPSISQNMCLVGGGGVGKTTCAVILLLYARSKGLTINATALVSERAQELGVPHLNNDFAIPKVDLHCLTPGQLAERIISSLYSKPQKLEFHRTVDVELIDELGPIAAEIWSARDITLRYIRNSNRPNGGKFDIATFDHLQMHPIQGTHPLLSPFLTSTFSFFELQESVRAAFSVPWQRVQAITRMPLDELSSPAIENEFIDLLVTNCTFIPSIDQAPTDALCVYGKNSPVRIHQRELQQSLRNKDNVIISVSDDYESNFEGRFVPAHRKVTHTLDNRLREQHELYLYKGARYRITYNQPGKFSNGQLAFLHELPPLSTIQKKRPIKLLVAPPGSSYLPGSSDTAESLLALGWKEISIGISRDNIVSYRSTRAKRSGQYGLQLYVGSTWHSTMGKTLAKMVTKVDHSGDRSSPYSIWDPTQVVIMLSRTRLPADTIFITDDPLATARTIFSVLKHQSPFRNYLSTLIKNLCNTTSDAPKSSIDQSISVYRPRDVLLPSDRTGFAYILISTRDMNFLYIGSCYNLLARYTRHNTGFGALQTAPPSLRPWAVLGYACGFQGNKQMFMEFERRWILQKQQLLHSSQTTASIEAVVSIGVALVHAFNSEFRTTLRFVHSGTITTLQARVGVPIILSSSEQEQDLATDEDYTSSSSSAANEFLSFRGTDDSPASESDSLHSSPSSDSSNSMSSSSISLSPEI